MRLSGVRCLSGSELLVPADSASDVRSFWSLDVEIRTEPRGKPSGGSGKGLFPCLGSRHRLILAPSRSGTHLHSNPGRLSASRQAPVTRACDFLLKPVLAQRSQPRNLCHAPTVPRSSRAPSLPRHTTFGFLKWRRPSPLFGQETRERIAQGWASDYARSRARSGCGVAPWAWPGFISGVPSTLFATCPFFPPPPSRLFLSLTFPAAFFRVGQTPTRQIPVFSAVASRLV